MDSVDSRPGHHYHIAGAHLIRYAQEAGWREDNRRADNGAQVSHIAAVALSNRPSVDFTGYWQRTNNLNTAIVN